MKLLDTFDVSFASHKCEHVTTVSELYDSTVGLCILQHYRLWSCITHGRGGGEAM